MAFRILPSIIAAVLLAAHFVRLGELALVAVCLCTPLLLLYRKRRVLLLLQALAYAGAATWMVVAARLVQARVLSGQHWTLAAAILGGVALFTVLAGLLLNSRTVRQAYPV